MILGGGAEIPVGIVIPYAGANAPNENWLLSQGQWLSKTEYPELYAVIGDTYKESYGVPDTHFRIPDLQNRVPIGVSNTHALGSTGGAETHKLTIAEMPSHNHNIYSNEGWGQWAKQRVESLGESSNNAIHSGYILNTGGDQPHNNMQPYVTLNYIIKVK